MFQNLISKKNREINKTNHPYPTPTPPLHHPTEFEQSLLSHVHFFLGRGSVDLPVLFCSQKRG